MGVVEASVMMYVVRGSVNTLIVCWADNPQQIERNHPALSREMIDAWARAFPDSMMDPNSVEPTPVNAPATLV
jgi:hypothetical protein